MMGQNSSGIYTSMAFHFINPHKPLGFGYETCLQDMTNSNIFTSQINI